MSGSFEEKIAQKKEKMQSLSESLRQKADSAWQKGFDLSSRIPFGQPVHRHKKDDVSYREKIDNTFTRASALEKKADEVARKIDSIGTGGISSDDPDSLEKLKEKLASAEKLQEKMKTVNQVLRRVKTHDGRFSALKSTGFTGAEIDEQLGKQTPYFQDFELRNNRAKITQIKSRIASIQAIKNLDFVEIKGAGYTYNRDPETNRVVFFFDEKPDFELKSFLKEKAFKWSPTRGAWVRLLSRNALIAAREVMEFLTKKTP